MKYAKHTIAKVVAANTPEEFEMKLNKILSDIAKGGYKHTLQFNCNAGFCAYITYEVTEQVAETIEDEFDLQGIHYTCADCPKYSRPTDGRVKYTYCEVADHGVRKNTCACEWLYEEVYHGRISLNDDEEQKIA